VSHAIDIPDHPMGTPRRWQVAFLPRGVQHWWDLFSPPWCRHVLCYGYVLQSQRWIVVNPAQDRTLVAVMTDDELESFLAQLLLEEPVIYKVMAGPGDSYANRIFQTCSSTVSRIIGLRGSAWRPMALIRMLKRENAEIIHGPKNEREGETAEGRPGDRSEA
jgi:hypothetical protein